MTITVNIDQDVEGELARQAAARGLAIEAYAVCLLEEAARASKAAPSQRAGAKDMVELFAPLRGLNLTFERDRDPGRDIEL
jgi:hypothetical protein